MKFLVSYQDDLEIKLVTLTGQGDKFFIAGGDIKELNAVRSDSDIDEMVKLGRKNLRYDSLLSSPSDCSNQWVYIGWRRRTGYGL